MSKVYSPTENLYALLALADEPNEKPAEAPKKNVPKPEPKVPGQPTVELTPKARAEAKAAQDAERKAKEEAERQVKAAEAERLRKQKEEEEEQRKQFEKLDQSGFAKQRLQRVKEKKIEPVSVNKGKGGKPRQDNQENRGKYYDNSTASPDSRGQRVPREYNRTDRPQGQRYNKDGQVAPAQTQGDRTNHNDGQDQQSRPPKREYDRQSGTGRGQGPKKGGYGRNNWDEPVAAALAAAAAAEVKSDTTPPQNWPDNADVDWNTVPSVTPVDDNAAVVVDPVDPVDPSTDVPATPATPEDLKEDEEAKKLSLDEYLVLQAEKKKALEALIGPTVLQPRVLSEEEKKSMAKFTMVENTKTKKPEKAVSDKKAPLVPTPAARKGATPVAADQLFNFRAPRRDGPRDAPRDGPRDANKFPRENRPPRQAPGSGDNRPPRENTGSSGDNRPPRQNTGSYGDNRPARQNTGSYGDNRPPRQNPGSPGDNRPPRNNNTFNKGPRDNRFKQDLSVDPKDFSSFPSLS